MTEKELLELVLQENQDAIEMMGELAKVSQVWDDLIDRDKEVTDNAINAVFISLLSTLPRNPFYASHLGELQPLIEGAIIDWLTANDLEQSGDAGPMSWILRDNLSSIAIGAAKIIGGMPWAIEISPIVRKFVHDESIRGYQDGIVRRKHAKS